MHGLGNRYQDRFSAGAPVSMAWMRSAKLADRLESRCEAQLLIPEAYRRFSWGRCQHRMCSGFTGRGLIWACPNARRPNGIRHGVAKRDPIQAALQLIGAGCEPSRCANTPHRRVWRCAHHLRVCSAACSSLDHSLERSRRAEYDRPTTFATLVPDGWQCPVVSIVGRLRIVATKLAR
jgi:hypothetical protein